MTTTFLKREWEHKRHKADTFANPTQMTTWSASHGKRLFMRLFLESHLAEGSSTGESGCKRWHLHHASRPLAGTSPLTVPQSFNKIRYSTSYPSLTHSLTHSLTQIFDISIVLVLPSVSLSPQNTDLGALRSLTLSIGGLRILGWGSGTIQF